MLQVLLLLSVKKTRLHVSPALDDWPSVLDDTKTYIWNTVLGTYNIDRKRRKDVLLKANTSWKNWKFRIRLRYDKYTTDAERKLNPPKGVKREDLEIIIRKCSTEAKKCKRAQGVAVRKQVKLLHTSGRRGAARTKQDLLKQSTTGMVTRTQLFVALHTPRMDHVLIRTPELFLTKLIYFLILTLQWTKKTWIMTLLEWYAVMMVMVVLEDIVMALQKLYSKLLPHTRKLQNVKSENEKTQMLNMIPSLKGLMKSQQLAKASKKSCHIIIHHPLLSIMVRNVVRLHLMDHKCVHHLLIVF